MSEIEEMERVEAVLREVQDEMELADMKIAEAEPDIPEDKRKQFNELVEHFGDAWDEMSEAFSKAEHINAGLRGGE